MAQSVIDISEHNGYVDFQQIKDAGHHVIIRCGYGDDIASQDDKQWARNISECERLGIPHGVYLYSYATCEAQARSEAQHALRLISGHHLQYPVYFDSEEPGTQGMARRAAEIFCEAMENAGYWAGIYASRSWYQSYLGGLGDRYTLWIASWGSADAGIACDMWQYTSDGVVAGSSARTDMNWCYRDFPAEIGGGSPSNPNVSIPAPAPSGDVPCIWLQARTTDGTVLPATRYPDYAGWKPNGAIQYLSAWTSDPNWNLDVTAHTAVDGWLPTLRNPSDISNLNDGAVGNHGPIDGLKLYLWSPNFDHAVSYKVDCGGGYYAAQVDTNVGPGMDGYAGDLKNPIYEVMAEIIKL